MLLKGNLLVLFCVGLALVPGVQSLDCTGYPAYNYLDRFLKQGNCESADMVFKQLHDLTGNQTVGNCRTGIITQLANHFGAQPHTPDHCQCSGTFKLQDYGSSSNLTHTCLQHHHGYAEMYNQYFTSNHQPLQNLSCRTHHSVWSDLHKINDNWQCEVDIVNHIYYSFFQHGDPCTCSDETAISTTSRTTATTTSTTHKTTTPATTTQHFSRQCTDINSYNYLNDFIHTDKCESVDLVFKYLHDITEEKGDGTCRMDIINKLASHFGAHDRTPDHCQCTGTFTLQNYSRSSQDGISEDRADRCRGYNNGHNSYHDLYPQFFSSDQQPQNLVCHTHHSLWTHLHDINYDPCQKDFVYHISYAFSQHGDPCSCSEKTITPSTLTTTTTTSTTQQTTTPTTTIKSDVTSTSHGSVVVTQTTISSHIENGWESWSSWTCKITKSDLSATCHNYRQRHCLSNMAADCEGPSLETMDCNNSQCSDITHVNCSLYNQHSTCEDQISCTYFSNTPWKICGDAARVAQCPRLCTCCLSYAECNFDCGLHGRCHADGCHCSPGYIGDRCEQAITTSPTTTSKQTTTTPPKPEAVMTTVASTSTTMIKTTPTASSTTTIITATTQPRTTETTKIQQSADPIISRTTQQPSTMLRQCNHTCTLDAVILSMAVKSSKAGICPDKTSESASNEALPMDCCNMGDHYSWIKGDQVQNGQVCTDGTPPPYTPIAAFNETGLIPDTAGIFYGCIKDGQSGFMMIHQTCELLPHLLHVDGTQGKDPNTYFMFH